MAGKRSELGNVELLEEHHHVVAELIGMFSLVFAVNFNCLGLGNEGLICGLKCFSLFFISFLGGLLGLELDEGKDEEDPEANYSEVHNEEGGNVEVSLDVCIGFYSILRCLFKIYFHAGYLGRHFLVLQGERFERNPFLDCSLLGGTLL